VVSDKCDTPDDYAHPPALSGCGSYSLYDPRGWLAMPSRYRPHIERGLIACACGDAGQVPVRHGATGVPLRGRSASAPGHFRTGCLTASERRVVELAAGGATNNESSQALLDAAAIDLARLASAPSRCSQLSITSRSERGARNATTAF